MRLPALALSCLLLPVLAGPAAAAPTHPANPLGRRLAFEENRGQTDARVRFLARAPGYTLFLTPSEAVLAPHGSGSTAGVPLRLRWVGAAANPSLAGEGEQPGRIHDLRGPDPAKWRTGIPTWEKVRYRAVWPGVDLVFYSTPRQLEYDFLIAPRADPRAIRLAVEGAERITIDAAGDLVLATAGGEARLRRPVSFQEADGVRRPVESRWRRLRDRTVGITVGRYDRSRPLVIDPVVVFSTYLGGGGSDEAYVFVARLDRGGSSLLWSARIGGSGPDETHGVAVDPAGRVYVVGTTRSPDFPVHAALQPSTQNAYDAFLIKLTPRGSFVYSTYLGGGSTDEAWDVAADPAGHAYVIGNTHSFDFPTRNAIQPTLGGATGNSDAFALRVTPDGSSLVWSTYLGGESGERGLGIAVSRSGDTYVTGLTMSADFPIRNALQPASASAPIPDAFVTRLDPAGSLVYSTYLGGSELDWGGDVAVDARGSAFVSGFTESTDFPLRDPLQTECRPSVGTFCQQPDLYLAEIAPAGDTLVWATYLGGTGSEEISSIAVGPPGSVFVAGTTFSTDFPTVNAFQATLGGGGDAFVTRIAPQRRGGRRGTP